MYLLDTSVLVAALTHEAHSQYAHAWLAANKSAKVIVTEWAATEFSAALSFKVRTNHMTASHQAISRMGFNELLQNSLQLLEVTTQQFRLAARLAERIESGLRGADALHLATAADRGGTMVTLDTGMARAAVVLDIKCALIQPASHG